MIRELMTPKATKRFFEKIDMASPDACWEWEAGTNPDGYGKLKLGGKTVATHRIMWACWYGAIPEGMDVLHKCDNPPCCNPRHLFLGNNIDNSRDRDAKGRQSKGLSHRLCAGSPKTASIQSKYKGVSWYKKTEKWIAGIRIDGRLKHLGYFTSEEDASQAYQDAIPAES